MLAEQLRALIYNSIYIINERNLVFLESPDDPSESGHCDTEIVGRLLAQGTSRMGVSSIFTNPMRIPSYIDEAKRAIEIGCKLNPEPLFTLFQIHCCRKPLQALCRPSVAFWAVHAGAGSRQP